MKSYRSWLTAETLISRDVLLIIVIFSGIINGSENSISNSPNRLTVPLVHVGAANSFSSLTLNAIFGS